MSFPTILLLAVALGTDAFSMCLGIGMTGVRRGQILLISVTILLFHIAMPLAGWYAGHLAGSLVGRAAGIAGALVLMYLGARMLWDVYRCDPEKPPLVALVNTGGLLLLAASVSMDALSVGFTLGTVKANLPLVALVFGMVAGLMTLGGLLLGRILGRWAGEKAQLAGGLILLGIGVKLVV
ncbi:MAG: manganese efflux pump MntP family protein [Actinobacteria bacterium]|nr:manganese efflux pump MntP family protein [Actinomycetota bacterium]